MKKTQGFSLIELLVVIVIVGILASIAVPSYMRYVERGKVTEGLNNLASRGVSLEQGFQDTGIYTCPANWSSTYFNYTCVAPGGGASFTLTAAGIGSMNRYSYSLNSAGVRATISHPVATSATCWLVSGTEGC